MVIMKIDTDEEDDTIDDDGQHCKCHYAEVRRKVITMDVFEIV